jgi:SSS family solute:Na+ symporter
VFALKPTSIRPAFFVASAVFLVVPLTLSLLGFAGAGLAKEVVGEAGNPTSWILQQHGTDLATVTDPQMIGPIMIGTFLPKIGLFCFTFMAFAALCSTLDSAFVATGALTGVDIYSRYFRPDASDSRILVAGRSSMAVVAALGLIISFSRPSLFWLFLSISAVAVGGIVPTLMLIFGNPPRARAITISVWASLLISLPTAIYANNNGMPDVQIVGTLIALAFSIILCLWDRAPNDPVPQSPS